jgi:hypothetical protein
VVLGLGLVNLSCWEGVMDSWEDELERNLCFDLGFEEDMEDEFENELFMQMVDVVSSEILGQCSSTPVVRGSVPGRKNVFRDRETYHNLLVTDYFSDNPTYGPSVFRRWFRMRREVFLRIVDAVGNFDPWFLQKLDACGRLSLSPLQKCTAALRMLAYGSGADATDEYCRLGESTAQECMRRFCVAIRGCFESTYLREPSRDDLVLQMSINENRGFPGMFGSLDCMHWNWKNCPVAWQGQFQDKDKNRSIILEAVADQSLWIWHAFFGLPGGNNDINVLDRSPFLLKMLQGPGQDLTFEVNGHVYSRYYVLTDGIYPPWSCFVHPIHEPQGEMKQHFTKCQEGARKDVERAFGVLQSRWDIIKNPVRQWDLGVITNIMIACIIMHNMIIEDERDLGLEPLVDLGAPVAITPSPFTFYDLQSGTREIENVQSHFALRNDLIDHLWMLRGRAR